MPGRTQVSSREAPRFRVRGFHPLRRAFPCTSTTTTFCNSPSALRDGEERSYNPVPATPAGYHSGTVWAVPVSLATTQGIEISFYSSRYLDVSVHALTSAAPMDSVQGTRALPRVGFPIRKSPDQRLFSVSPRLIAAVHVLHRPQMPRHPPCALVLLLDKEHQSSLCSCQGASGVAAGLPPPRGRPPGAQCVPVPESRAMDTGRRPRNAIVPALTRSTFFQASRVTGRHSQKGETSTGSTASGVIAPDSLERR